MRRLRESNETLKTKFFSTQGAEELLYAVGFRKRWSGAEAEHALSMQADLSLLARAKDLLDDQLRQQ